MAWNGQEALGANGAGNVQLNGMERPNLGKRFPGEMARWSEIL